MRLTTSRESRVWFRVGIDATRAHLSSGTSDHNEGTAIIGGETLWYWIGYGVGTLGYMVTHLNPNQTSGQKLMNAALG